MKTLSALAFGLCFGALAACGDDDGSGGSGGATTSTTSAVTGTSASTTGAGTTTATTASSSSSSSASTGTTGAGGGGMTGCEENPQECITNSMDCQCTGTCAICNDIECFDYELEVECINGFAGVTCTCMVDGELAGNCDQDEVACGLETNCCFQFLQP